MNRRIYTRLALANIKNNRKTYIPYILTAVLTVMMLFIMHGLAVNDSVGNGAIAQVLMMAVVIIMIFFGIFLFYTNSFLIKRRKKEIGVYNILGMGKRHIAKMLAVETVIISGVSIGMGLLFGAVFSRLMWMILTRLMNYDTGMEYMIYQETVIGTIIFFCIVFVLTLIYNLMQIRLSNPAELLRGSSQGEKEPKTKLLLTVIGLLLVGYGYYIAVTVETPLAALGQFFIAVIVVILGTYALFTAGSIALLKLLRRNKKFYYQSKRFTAVSGMIYRMKQNAAGLANICILSTMVLVLVSTSVSMYLGAEDMLYERYPKEVSITAFSVEPEKEQEIETAIAETCKEYHVEPVEKEVSHYGTGTVIREGNKLALSSSGDYSDEAVGEIYMFSQEEYNRITGEHVDLKENEVIFYTTKEENYGWDTLQIENKSYHIVKELTDMWTESKNDNRLSEAFFVIFNGTEQIEEWLQYIYNKADDIDRDWLDVVCRMRYKVELDLEGRRADCIAANEALEKKVAYEIGEVNYESREQNRKDFYGMYGGLLFIGIYLGAMFLMATVLIIYYKQISEGYDDRERYQIMKKVGMGEREVKRSIRSQVLLVFFIPLAAAVLHVSVAFTVVKKLLVLLYLTNESLFLMCTVAVIAVFAVFYVIVYSLTAREYYRIIR